MAIGPHVQGPTEKRVIVQLFSNRGVLYMCIAAVLIALITNGYTCSDGGCRPQPVIPPTETEVN